MPLSHVKSAVAVRTLHDLPRGRRPAHRPAAGRPGQAPQGRLRVDPPAIATDKSVKYDYDIVYVRAPRIVKGSDGKERPAPVWPEMRPSPTNVRRRGRPDAAAPRRQRGSAGRGRQGRGRRPVRLLRRRVGLLRALPPRQARARGADIYKIHVKTQEGRPPDAPGVHAEHRRAWRSPKPHAGEGKTHRSAAASTTWARARCRAAGSSSPATATASRRRAAIRSVAMQLFVMDDDGGNVEKIGHLNVGLALHPVVLKDGRVMFSSLEIAGRPRQHRSGASGASTPTAPTGTRSSAPSTLGGAPIAFHFQTQLSDEQHRRRRSTTAGKNEGFGTFVKLPPRPPAGTPPFGPAVPRTIPGMARPIADIGIACRSGPTAWRSLTRFAHGGDWPALSVRARQERSRRASARSRTRRARRTITCLHRLVAGQRPLRTARTP